MKVFLRNFWAWAGTLAGIAALYVGAQSIKKTQYFFAVIVVAVVLAGARPAFRLVTVLGIRVRNYPNMLTRLAEAESQIEESKKVHTSQVDAVEKARSDGIREGRAQVLGAALGEQLKELPAVTGIMDDDGTIALVGACPANSIPRAGTRLKVISEASGELKGIVEVTRVDEERSFACMRCVAPTAPRFWEHLSERVDYDDSPPKGVQLSRVAIETVAPDYAFSSETTQ